MSLSDAAEAQHAFSGDLLRVMTAVRVRPFSASEAKSTTKLIVSVPEPERPDEGSVVVIDPLYYGIERSLQERKFFERRFNFDVSFSSGVGADAAAAAPNQALVFEKLGEPLIHHLLQGYNCSILAYGQTGSGKTFTMIGEEASSDLAGIIPRLCRGLLQEISRRMSVSSSSSALGGPSSESAMTTTAAASPPPYRLQSARVSCSFYEIYCEKVYDLLQPSPDGAEAQPHSGGSSRVREHPDDGAYVENLTYTQIRTYEDAAALMSAGLRQRAVAETRMNASSSRSHAVFTIVVKQSLCAAGGAILERGSKIVLVDLAGSERASLTGATGERLIEANNINKSLSVLGDVIKALSETTTAAAAAANGGADQHSSMSRPPHRNSSSSHSFVPYRNSILTFLLKDSLGGSSRTVMLATVSPSEASFNETISTLRYVERAKYIAAAPIVHEHSTDPAFVVLLQKQIVGLQEKLLVANRSRHARDLELRAEFSRQEHETAREHQRHVTELRDQLRHLSNRSTQSQPNSPIGISTPSPTPTKDPASAAATSTPEEDEQEPVADAAVLKLLEDCAGGDPGKQLLLLEVHRLSAALGEKERQLAAASAPAAVAAASSTNQQALASLDKQKRLTQAYRTDKAALQAQNAALLLQLKALSDSVDAEKARVEVLEGRLAQMQSESTERKAQCRRFESALEVKDEEVQTCRIENEFLKAKLASATAKHKQELVLLQNHVQKAKESEESVRREKESDSDRYTELMVDAQRRNEADREVAESKLEKLTLQLAQQGVEAAALSRDKERFREALNSKLEEAVQLEAQLAAQRVEAVQHLQSAVEEASVVEAALKRQLTASEASLLETKTLLSSLEGQLAARTQELAQERQTLARTEAKLSIFQDEMASKENERRRLASGEELLKAALDKEARQLQEALFSVTTTRSALDEKDKAHHELSVRALELDIALQSEQTARQEAEKRAVELHADLTRRKKKLAAALEALEENKTKIATVGQLDARVKAAEAKFEAAASAAIESDTRHAKKDQKLLDLQAAATRHQTELSEVNAALREAKAQTRRLQDQAQEVQAKSRADVKSLKLEHALLLEEVISLREQLDAQSAEHVSSLDAARQSHGAELEELDRRRADQYLSQQQALAAAEERSALTAQQLDELRTGYDTMLSKAHTEAERRRRDATNDVHQRLDRMLLGSDEFDDQYVAVQRVLSMIDLNMLQLDSELRAAALIEPLQKNADSSAVAAQLAVDGVNVQALELESQQADSAHLSPKLVEFFDGILGRQRRMFGAVRSLKGTIQELALSPFGCSPLATSSSGAADLPTPSTPTRPHVGESDSADLAASASSPTHLVEHDQTSMSQEIIKTKLALAVAASENEDLRVAYRRMERVACDLKLRVATLQSEVEDKEVIIGGLMDRVTALQRQGGAKESSPSEGWGLNLSSRGRSSTSGKF